MDYGFENFHSTTFPIQNLSKAVIPVMDGKKKSVSFSPLPELPILSGNFDQLTIVYEIPEIIYAPVRKNIPIGKVSFYINDRLYHVEKVFPIESIEKFNFSDTIERVLHIWMEIFGF